jgi:hypothetical protein
MKKLILITFIQFLFIQKVISQNERIKQFYQIELFTRWIEDSYSDDSYEFFESLGANWGIHSRISESNFMIYNSLGYIGQSHTVMDPKTLDYSHKLNYRFFSRFGISLAPEITTVYTSITLFPLCIEINHKKDFISHYGFMFSVKPFKEIAMTFKMLNGYTKRYTFDEISMELGLAWQFDL